MFAKFVKKFADAEGSAVRSFLDLYTKSYSIRRSGSDKTKYASATTYTGEHPVHTHVNRTAKVAGKDAVYTYLETFRGLLLLCGGSVRKTIRVGPDPCKD